MEGMKDNEIAEAQVHIYNHMFSFMNSMSLRCAIQLGIPDIIHRHGKPITLYEIVQTLSIPSTKSVYVYRLMEPLVHAGFFTKQKLVQNDEEVEGFMLTPNSMLLCKSNSLDVSGFVLAMTHPVMVNDFHYLTRWFQAADSDIPFEIAHGSSFWNYTEKDLEFNKCFYEGLACDSKLTLSVIVKEHAIVFENLKSLVDAGGGIGTAAQVIAESFPQIKCSVLDLPCKVSSLPKCKNVDYIGGDFFESIPRADAILFKFLLHGYSDDECIKILKLCREAIPPKEQGGKVIIIETVTDWKVDDEAAKTRVYFDLIDLTSQRGRERTEKEWSNVFVKSGFSKYKITPILGFRNLIEVFP